MHSPAVARTRLVVVVALSALVLVPAASPATATGQQRVLVILGTWGAQPFSIGSVQRVTQAAADFYRASSFGRIDLRFDVTPWLDAFSSDPGCAFTSQSNLDQLMQPARLAAQRAGYSPSDYPRLVYVFASGHCGCHGGAWGQEMTLTRAPDLALLVHELGHSLGLAHAGTTQCADSCEIVEPGDPYSPMGTGAKLLDFSAYEKFVLGWLPPQPHATRNGIYTLVPASAPGPGAHAVIVDTEYSEWWIEYRTKFPGLLVRLVDREPPTLPLAFGPILIVNPTHHHRDWVAPGETYRTDTFSVQLVRAGEAQAQVRIIRR
jgi:hypothetical protein